MLKLVKGNEENLEGRVIVYSKFKDTGEAASLVDTPFGMITRPIFAIYAATNLTDFAERFGIPKDVLEKEVNEIKEFSNRFFQEYRIKAETVPIFVINIPVSSEADLLTGSEDVVYVGEYYDKSLGVDAIRYGIEFYLTRFYDQMKAPLELKDSPFKQDWPALEKTYKDIEETGMENYITNRFISPMMYAISCEDSKKITELIKEFISFGRGADFVTDIFNLCTAIKSDGKKQDPALIEVYVKRIAALHRKDYRTAADLNNKIKELNPEE